jgi:ABC-type lipoprotein release transport system permease subunit
MTRIVLTYGVIAGIIVAACMVTAMAMGVQGGALGMAVGYLGMLLALTMVFIGIRQYRDRELGGAIRFPTALLVGFGISLVATLCYAMGWEAYLYATDYRFMPEYIAATLEAKRAAGASPAELATLSAEMQGYLDLYANPSRAS